MCIYTQLRAQILIFCHMYARGMTRFSRSLSSSSYSHFHRFSTHRWNLMLKVTFLSFFFYGNSLLVDFFHLPCVISVCVKSHSAFRKFHYIDNLNSLFLITLTPNFFFYSAKIHGFLYTIYEKPNKLFFAKVNIHAARFFFMSAVSCKFSWYPK